MRINSNINNITDDELRTTTKKHKLDKPKVTNKQKECEVNEKKNLHYAYCI